MCLFSAAMRTSQCKLRSLRANPLPSISQRVASPTLDRNGVFAIKAYCSCDVYVAANVYQKYDGMSRCINDI